MKAAHLSAPGIVFTLAVATIGAGFHAPASAQEYRGTWQQQMACTPDVWRLCSDQVPDVGRIVSCLRQNTPQLSNGCRAVFESQANAQQPAARVPQQQVPPRGSATTRQPQAVQPGPDQDDE